MSPEPDAAVPSSLLAHVPNWAPLYGKGYRWFEYQVSMCDLAQTLAVADLLWPPLVEIDDCVLLNLGAGLGQSIQSLRALYGSDRDVERQFNMMRLAELVATDSPPRVALIEDDDLIVAFGEVLRTVWTARLTSAFPSRAFRVELGDDIGETGMAITFYQTDRVQL